jgi:peptidylprolyl isomerase
MLGCASLALGACGDDDSPVGAQRPEAQKVPVDESDLPRVDATRSGIPKRVKLTKPDLPPLPSWPKNLVIWDVSEGVGPTAQDGDQLTIEYLAVDDTGKALFTSWDHFAPLRFRFVMGTYATFTAFEDGIEGMRLGSRRKMLIPPQLSDQRGPLFYAIDLLEINRDGKCWMAPPRRSISPERLALMHGRCKGPVKVI